MTDSVKLLIEHSVDQLNSFLETLAAIRNETDKLSSQLPEYNTVMDFYSVGTVLGSQLIAEQDGSITARLFTAFAGLTLLLISLEPLTLSQEVFPNVDLRHCVKLYFRLLALFYKPNLKTTLFTNFLTRNVPRTSLTRFT